MMQGVWDTYSTSHAWVTESRGYSMQGENSLLYVLFSKTILCFLDPQLAGRKTSQEETVLFVLAVVLIIANAGTIVLLIKFLHDGLKRYVGKLLLHLHVWLCLHLILPDCGVVCCILQINNMMKHCYCVPDQMSQTNNDFLICSSCANVKNKLTNKQQQKKAHYKKITLRRWKKTKKKKKSDVKMLILCFRKSFSVFVSFLNWAFELRVDRNDISEANNSTFSDLGFNFLIYNAYAVWCIFLT